MWMVEMEVEDTMVDEVNKLKLEEDTVAERLVEMVEMPEEEVEVNDIE